MPTTNIDAGAAWVKVADASATELLITFVSPVTVEVATTAADAAPTVAGHRLGRDSAITRGALGAGFVWIRCTAPESIANLVVSK